MSLVDSHLEKNSQPGIAYTNKQTATQFDEPIFDEYHDMDEEHPDTLAPSPKRVRTNPTNVVPELPKKSSRRVSRILDNHGLKLGGEEGQATAPHDIYLSSEEDASSDADDFSEYDYDSSIEDPDSPTAATRRGSQEVTARVVSVVFAGKPSIVNLSLRKQRSVSLSSSSVNTSRTRNSTESSESESLKPSTTAPIHPSGDRPITPASSLSARSSNPNRRSSSSLLSDLLANKRKPPAFLSIDPYANGSHYSLEAVPKPLDSLEGEAAKTPRTPTQILKGVTRSFSLARKKSRPTLDTSESSVSHQPRPSTSTKRSSLQHSVSVSDDQLEEHDEEKENISSRIGDKTPQTPITYNDILRAVKKNAIVMSGSQPGLPSDILSPTSPNTERQKRGILSGLSARRRSVKFTGRV
ncbi:hypothetical protein QC761_211520 [Podospora bellae-mahoneyi]|uniref:Shugoshin C-terminal domain-containing protein n=1 Tax=Podospora bellae-mahoneyi TaxID=2093777 RepID=A0ABR0FRH3_9PEZI|nr:hypothetical protein QC761_211520 [Podospora bellae-mahoneyi]